MKTKHKFRVGDVVTPLDGELMGGTPPCRVEAGESGDLGVIRVVDSSGDLLGHYRPEELKFISRKRMAMKTKHKFKRGQQVIFMGLISTVLGRGKDGEGHPMFYVRFPSRSTEWVYERDCVPFKSKSRPSKARRGTLPRPTPQMPIKRKETAQEATPEALPKWAMDLSKLLISTGWVVRSGTGQDKELAKFIMENVPVCALVPEQPPYDRSLIELQEKVADLTVGLNSKSAVIKQLILALHNLS